MTFTNEQKLEALRRELKMRMRVYSRFVIEGKMTQEKSEHELGVVRAMIEDYARLCETERLI